jgi:hypothetical protein
MQQDLGVVIEHSWQTNSFIENSIEAGILLGGNGVLLDSSMPWQLRSQSTAGTMWSPNYGPNRLRSLRYLAHHVHILLYWYIQVHIWNI